MPRPHHTVNRPRPVRASTYILLLLVLCNSHTGVHAALHILGGTTVKECFSSDPGSLACPGGGVEKVSLNIIAEPGNAGDASLVINLNGEPLLAGDTVTYAPDSTIKFEVSPITVVYTLVLEEQGKTATDPGLETPYWYAFYNEDTIGVLACGANPGSCERADCDPSSDHRDCGDYETRGLLVSPDAEVVDSVCGPAYCAPCSSANISPKDADETKRKNKNLDYCFWIGPTFDVWKVFEPGTPRWLYTLTVTIETGGVTEVLVLNSLADSFGTSSGEGNIFAKLVDFQQPGGDIAGEGYGWIVAPQVTGCMENGGKAAHEQFDNPLSPSSPDPKSWMWYDSNNVVQSRFGDACNQLGVRCSTWAGDSVFEKATQQSICESSPGRCIPGFDNWGTDPVGEPTITPKEMEANLNSDVGARGTEAVTVSGRPNFLYHVNDNNCWCDNQALACKQNSAEAKRANINFLVEFAGTLVQLTRGVSPGQINALGGEFDCNPVVGTGEGSIKFEVCNTGAITAAYTVRITCSSSRYSFPTGSSFSTSLANGACATETFGILLAPGDIEEGNTCTLTLEDSQGTPQNAVAISCKETTQLADPYATPNSPTIPGSGGGGNVTAPDDDGFPGWGVGLIIGASICCCCYLISSSIGGIYWIYTEQQKKTLEAAKVVAGSGAPIEGRYAVYRDAATDEEGDTSDEDCVWNEDIGHALPRVPHAYNLFDSDAPDAREPRHRRTARRQQRAV